LEFGLKRFFFRVRKKRRAAAKVAPPRIGHTGVCLWSHDGIPIMGIDGREGEWGAGAGGVGESTGLPAAGGRWRSPGRGGHPRGPTDRPGAGGAGESPAATPSENSRIYAQTSASSAAGTALSSNK